MPNHHFVPECYLKWFTDPFEMKPDGPRIWQAEIKSKRIRARPLRKVASAAGYNSLTADDEGDSQKVEKLYSLIESNVAPVLKQLNEGHGPLSFQHREELLYFAATLANRGPRKRAEILNPLKDHLSEMADRNRDLPLEQFHWELNEALPEGGITPNQAAELQEKLRQEDALQFEVRPDPAIWAGLIASHRVIYRQFTRMTWRVVRSIGEWEFLCSDCPVSWSSPWMNPGDQIDADQLGPDVEVSFPVGRSKAVVGRFGKDSVTRVHGPEEIQGINCLTVFQAYEEILAPSRQLAEWGLAVHPENR